MLLALYLVMSQAEPATVTRPPRVQRSERAGRAVPWRAPLCNILADGDKAGAWECMKGDGSMLSGSATAFVATGAPTNSIENGQAVRTYTSSQNDQQPSNAALPASSFSVCMHHRSTSNAALSYLGGFANSGSNAGFAVLPWEIQGVGGDWLAYISNGVNITSTASVASITAGNWYLLCMTYERVGGAADNVLRIYVNGAQVASASNQRLAQALSSVWTTNGFAGGGSGAAKSVRGFFVTYKVLSADDIARLSGRLSL